LAFEDRYFTDTNIDLRNKDAFINIQGKWIMEMPECESLFRNGYNLSKSWITSQSDRYRAPFAQYATDHPRQCAFIATTNEQDLGFLADPTGNRRFWALLVGEVDLESLKSDMEQLWAEALFRYRAKETWWLSKNVELLRKYQNDRFALGDSWEDAIYMFLFSGYRNKDNFYVFTMDQVYDKLGIESEVDNEIS
jgi:putative DNA primase/helicase